MALNAYKLRNFKVEYGGYRAEEVEKTLSTLKNTLSWINGPSPIPQRLPRRERRFFHLKSSRGYGYAKRHYVFQDHRYAVNFVDVHNPSPVISSALGSMRPEVWCNCYFSWHYDGYDPALSSTAPVEVKNEPNISDQEIIRRKELEAARLEKLQREQLAIQKLIQRMDERDITYGGIRSKWNRV